MSDFHKLLPSTASGKSSWFIKYRKTSVLFVVANRFQCEHPLTHLEEAEVYVTGVLCTRWCGVHSSRKDPPVKLLTYCDLWPPTSDLIKWSLNGGQKPAQGDGRGPWEGRVSFDFKHPLKRPIEEEEDEKKFIQPTSEGRRSVSIYKTSIALLKLINTHNWRHPVILWPGLRKLFCGTLIIWVRTPGYKYCQHRSLPNSKWKSGV